MTNIDDTAIDKYVNEARHADIAKQLHELVLAHSNLSAAFKWSMPVYVGQGKDVCYIKDTKEGVNLGFTNGSSLRDVAGILEGTGKDMRHIKVKSLERLSEIKPNILDLLDQSFKFEPKP